MGGPELDTSSAKKKKPIPSFQKTCRKTLESVVETITDTLFWYESEKVQRGRLLRWLHEVLGLTFGFLILLLHTLLPSWILLKIVLCLALCTSFTHALTGVCVVTTTEMKLTKEEVTIVDPILHSLGLPVTMELRTFLTVYAFLTLCGLFLYEAGARKIPTIRGWISV
jgi:hypothetical protein